MARDAIPTWFFVLVIVRRDDAFLLVHEHKHGQRWFYPAGRVEPGETFIDAAVRETLEESGISVEIDGLIRIEHTAETSHTRVRVLLTAHPVDDTPPKSIPDEESLEAGWFTLEEIRNLPLRGQVVVQTIEYVARGGEIAPLSVLTFEGAPFA